MLVVHNKFLVQKFQASSFSPANFIRCMTWSLNVLLAIFIVYRSDGMWMKTMSVFVKPDVHFQHDLIIVLDKSHPFPGKLVYSTFSAVNKYLSTSNFRVPRITNYEVDDDGDGRFDLLNIEIQVPLQSNEEITGIFLVFFFDWHLRGSDRMSKKFRMESTAVIDYKSNSPGSAFAVSGSLIFQQKDLLKEDFGHLSLQTNIRGSFQRTVSSMDSFTSFHDILQEYFDRTNFSTSLSPQSSTYLWTNGRDVSFDAFKVKITINYPSQEVLYQPGFWYNMKWAFIQLCPIFLVIYFIMEWIRGVIFEQHMIPTVQTFD